MFLTQWSVKKAMLKVFCDINEPITIDIFEKGATVNRASHYQFL